MKPDPQLFLKKFIEWSNHPLEEQVFERNEYLSKAGQIEHFLYLIVDGAVRAIYISEDEEHTIRFGYKGSVISSLDSFISGEPTVFYLQALRRTTTLKIPRSIYLDFIQSSQEVSQMHIELYNNLVVTMLERELDLLTTSPVQRYQRVLERSPQVFQEIPLKYIANYLRMTPETLSRLRNS